MKNSLAILLMAALCACGKGTTRDLSAEYASEFQNARVAIASDTASGLTIKTFGDSMTDAAIYSLTSFKNGNTVIPGVITNTITDENLLSFDHVKFESASRINVALKNKLEASTGAIVNIIPSNSMQLVDVTQGNTMLPGYQFLGSTNIHVHAQHHPIMVTNYKLDINTLVKITELKPVPTKLSDLNNRMIRCRYQTDSEFDYDDLTTNNGAVIQPYIIKAADECIKQIIELEL